MLKKIFNFKLLIGFFISLLVAGTVIFLTLFGGLKRLELTSLDLRFLIRGPQDVRDSDLIIIAIDSQTYKALKKRFPFPREYYATLIENLNDAGVKLIMFDIQFTEPDYDNPEGDSILADAVKRYGNVILAGQYLPMKRRGQAGGMDKPIKVLLETGAEWGIVNEIKDADGFTRKYNLFMPHEGKLHLSLGLKVIKLLNNIPDDAKIEVKGDYVYYGNTRIYWYGENNTMLINYYGPAGTFRTYSFSNVLDDAGFELREGFDEDYMELWKEESMFPPEIREALGGAEGNPFKDKVALIGVSIEDLHDNKYTPFYNYQGKKELMPGVETHAHAIQTILDQNFIYTISFKLEILMVILLSFLTFIIIYFLKPLRGLFVVLIELALVVFLIIWVFKNRSYWINLTSPVSAIILSYFGNVVYQFLSEQKEKRMIKGAFSHYVPKKVVGELLKNPQMLKLGGERRFLTVLFSDIQGFTSVSEKMEPEILVNFLNEYLTELTNIVLKYDGIIDKYEGDAIMAEFGAPIYLDDHAVKGCYAALEMQERLAELRRKWVGEGLPEIHTRIGLNTGTVALGNFGSLEVFDYTVLGDEVNLGARLESANKRYRTYLMISENTFREAKDFIIVRQLDIIRVMGKTEGVKVYELLGRKDGNSSIFMKDKELLKHYNKGIELYFKKEWDKAQQCFKKALEIDPKDGPSEVYYKRCAEYIVNPPPDDWDGVYVMTTK